MNSFYTEEELQQIGFKHIGQNVLISKKTSIYSPGKISIGDNVRIDDFALLSGNITIGNNSHISAYCALYGGGEIVIDDYSGCSARCTLISASDDFSGEYMIGAVIDEEYTNVTKGLIHLCKYVQLGSGTVVLPNVTIHEGSVTGAMSLVLNDLDEWGIYVGVPAKELKERKKGLLLKVKQYEER